MRLRRVFSLSSERGCIPRKRSEDPGFPLYFVTLLGIWKLLGGFVILLPGFARVEEWAYAGMLFDLTGAAVASAVSGKAWWHLVAPLAIAAVLVASWAWRPQSCKLAVSIGRQEA
jgi:hypothetical protein